MISIEGTWMHSSKVLCFALLALACAHPAKLLTPEELTARHAQLVLEHHVIDLSLPAKGGRCIARVFPLDDGHCATNSSEPGSTKLVQGVAACGQTVSLCGHTLACDCSHPLPSAPCKGREVRGFGYSSPTRDGGQLFTMFQPPEQGSCQLLVSVTDGTHPPETATGFALVGETLPIQRSKQCRCEDFQ
jgi:hypothetical protein